MLLSVFRRSESPLWGHRLGGVAGLDRALAGGRLARHLVENAVLRGLSATGLERILNRPGLGEASNAYT